MSTRLHTRTLLAAPLAAFLLLGPLVACTSGPEEQVCAVLEADGDDYVEIGDPMLCPPPGTAASAQGPLWVPVSQLDTDDDDHRAVRTTVRNAPRTSTSAPRTSSKSSTKTSPTTSAKKTTTSRSR